MNLDAMAQELLRLMETLPRRTPKRMMQELSKGEAFLMNYLLAADSPVRPVELSRAMDTSTARVSAAINSMERKGWAVRQADPADHRGTLVSLTGAGREFIIACRRGALENMKAVLMALGERDAAEYLRILGRLEAIYADMRGEDDSVLSLIPLGTTTLNRKDTDTQ